MTTLIGIVLAMMLTDIIGTSLVIAESRGRAIIAGILDAFSDVTRLIYTILGVKAIDDISQRSAGYLLAVCITSFATTTVTTKIVHRMTADETSA